jgi:hypothetical protein
MGVNPGPFARGDDLDALGGDIEGGDGEEKPETREGTDRANLGLLEIPSVGLVIEERLFYVKAQAVFLEGVQGGGFIADDGPKLAVDIVVAKGDVGVFRKSCLTGLNPLIFRSRNGDLHRECSENRA